MSRPQPCPCGSGRAYSLCCGPCHDGAKAASAEALMRSRYCAFALQRGDYLLATWHPGTRPPELVFEVPAPRWIGLRILATSASGPDQAEVEFIATCRIGGRAERLHERSRFVREGGCWFYLDGEFPPSDQT